MSVRDGMKLVQCGDGKRGRRSYYWQEACIIRDCPNACDADTVKRGITFHKYAFAKEN